MRRSFIFTPSRAKVEWLALGEEAKSRLSKSLRRYGKNQVGDAGRRLALSRQEGLSCDRPGLQGVMRSLMRHSSAICDKDVATDSKALWTRMRKASRARAPATRVCLAVPGECRKHERPGRRRWWPGSTMADGFTTSPLNEITSISP
jgi:hypothetical protein